MHANFKKVSRSIFSDSQVWFIFKMYFANAGMEERNSWFKTLSPDEASEKIQSNFHFKLESNQINQLVSMCIQPFYFLIIWDTPWIALNKWNLKSIFILKSFKLSTFCVTKES